MKLLAEGEFTLNESSNDSRGATPKLFELLMALSVLRIGTNVEVDDPERSSKAPLNGVELVVELESKGLRGPRMAQIAPDMQVDSSEIASCWTS